MAAGAFVTAPSSENSKDPSKLDPELRVLLIKVDPPAS